METPSQGIFLGETWVLVASVWMGLGQFLSEPKQQPFSEPMLLLLTWNIPKRTIQHQIIAHKCESSGSLCHVPCQHTKPHPSDLFKPKKQKNKNSETNQTTFYGFTHQPPPTTETPDGGHSIALRQGDQGVPRLKVEDLHLGGRKGTASVGRQGVGVGWGVCASTAWTAWGLAQKVWGSGGTWKVTGSTWRFSFHVKVPYFRVPRFHKGSR